MTLALMINVAAAIALTLLLAATMRLPYRLPVAGAAPPSNVDLAAAKPAEAIAAKYTDGFDVTVDPARRPEPAAAR